MCSNILGHIYLFHHCQISHWDTDLKGRKEVLSGTHYKYCSMNFELPSGRLQWDYSSFLRQKDIK
jgi:hypothetical protein